MKECHGDACAADKEWPSLNPPERVCIQCPLFAGNHLRDGEGRRKMCSVVFIGEYGFEAQRDVELALGSPVLYVDGTPPGARGDGDGCLCWLDVKAMAERAGLFAHYDGSDWLITKTAESPFKQ